MRGKLTISRISSNQVDDNGQIRAELVDETSGIEFLRISISPEAFALALTGLGRQECGFVFYNLENVGKRREVKTEVVPTVKPRSGWQWTEEEKQSFLAPFEVDGWLGRPSDIGNNHRLVGNNSYKVSFVRFVEEV